MRRAFAIREVVLGPQHADTQLSQRMVAAIESRLREASQ